MLARTPSPAPPALPQGGLEGEGLALARGNMAAPELARLLYWLLVVGYSLRTIEVRFDLDAQLGLPPSAPSLDAPPEA